MNTEQIRSLEECKLYLDRLKEIITGVLWECYSKKSEPENSIIHKQEVPENFTYATEFSLKYKFVSNAYVSDSVKKNISFIENKNRYYFDPVDFIKFLLKEKPAKPYNNMMLLRDNIPELNGLIEKASGQMDLFDKKN